MKRILIRWRNGNSIWDHMNEDEYEDYVWDVDGWEHTYNDIKYK